MNKRVIMIILNAPRHRFLMGAAMRHYAEVCEHDLEIYIKDQAGWEKLVQHTRNEFNNQKPGETEFFLSRIEFFIWIRALTVYTQHLQKCINEKTFSETFERVQKAFLPVALRLLHSYKRTVETYRMLP